MRKIVSVCGIGLTFFMSCTTKKDTFDSAVVNTDYAAVSLCEVSYAKHFSVTYHGTYKLVTTNATVRQWKGEDEQKIEDVLVLYQRGSTPPALEGDLSKASLIEIPVKQVATNLESTEVFLEELGLQNKIKAVGGLISFYDSIRENVIKGNIGQVGYSWHQPPNMEVMLERKIDLFLMTLSNLEYKESLTKCRELGIPTATVFDWAEEHYLAQAEWIKYFALFFNEEEKATRIFNQIESDVNLIRQSVTGLEDKPTVMWGYHTGKGRWLFHHHSIESQLMKDAGLQNIFEDTTRAIRNEGEPVSTEQLLQLGKDVDHWIIGDVHSAALPNEKIMSSFKSWQTGKLYHNMKRTKLDANAFDWYGSAPVRPDRVLADLVKLMHPEISLQHDLVFMDKFDKKYNFPIPEGEF